ncbi:hypothetical protein SUGI_0336250 [Cryptomeria japonica]|nr:hypothetical protein SUGI_0336210 [Cryptomeria japonica]GLJ18820.1 hypothetical protein SUGI_0336250 [Cryptomeria japonica]
MDSASTVKVGGKKRDPCWKHGRPGPKRGDVFCNHCKKIVKGGINRFKYHLAKIQCRDTTSCTECTEEATRDAIATLEAYDQRKATKKRTAEAMAAPRADLSSMGSHTDVGTSGSSLGPRIRAKGTLDSNMENFFIPRNTPGAQPGLLGTAWNKEAHQQAKVACARFFIYNDVPFNAISSPSWDQLVTALTVAGKGFKSPSRYEVSGPLLQDEVQNTHALVEEQRTIWEKNGCTILSDGWTDGRNRTLINFLVASGGQLVFLKSIDASNEVKNAETLCNMLDEVVMDVGVQNVIQVVTDNAAAYVAAGKVLMARHPTLFWSPCAAHCLDLLLEDIGKLSWVKKVVEDGRNITKYIYNHTWVLNLMREHTEGKDLVRSGVTRFATNFLTLQSILATLPNLKRMFVSERWLGSPYATKPEAEKVVIAIFDTNFAKIVEEIINVSEPLVRVLRMVDGDHNSMGYLYEAMDKAKEAIQHLYGSNKTKYEPIWRIIDRRWNHQLHQHIHVAAYFLNPKFFYSPSFRADAEVRIGLDTCIRRLVDDEILRDLILDELQSYKKALGELFSSPDCKRRRATLRPDLWWEDYGATTPNLQKLAIRILSQPCSASGCERNWSVFENIHTKKRNRLTQQRLNDLVYVRYNIRLHEKKVLGQDSHEALDLDDIDPYAAEWVASPDDVDNDLDPFLTNEQLSELERAGEEWDAEVAAREEEQEVDHAAEAPVRVEDVATTSAPPIQRPQSVLSFSRRRNL